MSTPHPKLPGITNETVLLCGAALLCCTGDPVDAREIAVVYRPLREDPDSDQQYQALVYMTVLAARTIGVIWDRMPAAWRAEEPNFVEALVRSMMAEIGEVPSE